MTPKRLQELAAEVLLGVLASILAYYVVTLTTGLRLDFSGKVIIALSAAVLVCGWLAARAQVSLSRLGFIKLHGEAENTTEQSLRDATSSYSCLGTSAYYVLCSPDTRESYLEGKRNVDFTFMTVDPDCRAAVSDQAVWETLDVAEVVERISETKRAVERLSKKGVKIKWHGYTACPTFRVIVVDQKKVLVSFYEPGKKGPECQQLELSTEGLLGNWFMLFFERSRLSAQRSKAERALATLLVEKVRTSRMALIDELKRSCSEIDDKTLPLLVDDLVEASARQKDINGSFREHCTLCRIADASEEELHLYDKPVMETPNLIVVPALGHFVDGYLLICSRKHLDNFGETDEATFQDLEQTKRDVAKLLEDAYGVRPVFFEHGPISQRGGAGSCIVHAHMHAVPIDIRMPPQIVLKNLGGGSIGSLDELKRWRADKRPYFYLECSDGSMFLYDAPVLKCQFGRQMLAQHLGLFGDEWDWRRHPQYERAETTWRKLQRDGEGRGGPC